MSRGAMSESHMFTETSIVHLIKVHTPINDIDERLDFERRLQSKYIEGLTEFD